MNKLNGLFSGMEISASGLGAQRRRLNAVADNLANASTTRTAEGGPYRRKIVQFSEIQQRSSLQEGGAAAKNKLGLDLTRNQHLVGEEGAGNRSEFSGVRAEIVEDHSPAKEIYDPGHPDADENGFVKYPNIEVVTEMVEMTSATRAYEANASAIKAFKEMAQKALEIAK